MPISIHENFYINGSIEEFRRDMECCFKAVKQRIENATTYHPDEDTHIMVKLTDKEKFACCLMAGVKIEYSVDGYNVRMKTTSPCGVEIAGGKILVAELIDNKIEFKRI